MSKTVMRVVVIGLVAMLGAKAEAHYFIVGGKAKYCSVCVDVASINHDPTPPPPAHTETFEFVVTIPADKAEILCLDGTVAKSTSGVELRLQKVIDSITNASTSGVSTSTAEVEAIISDAAFRTKSMSISKFNFCTDLSPVDVLIRTMNLKIISKECTSTPCKQISSLEAVCTLSDKFDLKQYPKKRPPIGTQYDCPTPTIEPPEPQQ